MHSACCHPLTCTWPPIFTNLNDGLWLTHGVCMQLIHIRHLYAFKQALIALTNQTMSASFLAGGPGQSVPGVRTGMSVTLPTAFITDALIILWCR